MPSQDRISPSDLAVRVLEQTDDLSTFDCSRNDIMGLNEFIHSEAKQFQKEGLGVTHLFFYNDEIVGFATFPKSKKDDVIRIDPINRVMFSLRDISSFVDL